MISKSLFTLLMGVTLLLSPLMSQAQDINYRCKQCSYKKVLRGLSRKAGLRFSYNDAYLPSDKISPNWSSASKEQVLKDLFGNSPLRYRIIRDQIILTRRKTPQTPKSPPTAAPQVDACNITAQIWDPESNEALISAVVRIPDLKRGALSDYRGRFEISNLVCGQNYTVEVRYVGFEPISLSLTAGNPNIPRIDLKSVSLELETAIIESDAIISRSTMSEATLSKEEIQVTQGITNDLIKSIGSLPGIGFANEPYSLNPQLAVRGGNKFENLYLTDYAPSFWPFYYVGKAIFDGEALEEVEVLTGGFPANFGHRMSSVIHFRSREVKHRGLEAFLSKDFYNSHARIQGALIQDKLSLMATYRASHLGFYLDPPWVVKASMEDMMLKVDWKASNRHSFSFSNALGIDHLGNPGDEPSVFQNGNTVSQSLQWQAVLNEKIYNKASLVHTLQDFEPQLPGGIPARLLLRKSGFRNDLSWFIQPRLKFRSGLEGTFVQNRCFSDSLNVNCNLIISQGYFVGGYALFEGNLNSRATFNAGLRSDFYQSSGELTISPRFSMGFLLSKKNSLRLAWGKYHQEPDVLLSSIRGGTVGTEHAWHYILGLKRQFSPSWVAWVEGYYKAYRNLVSGNHQLGFSNQGFGQSRGVDFFLKKGKGRWGAWASYSLAFSDRKKDDWLEQHAVYWQQQHIINLGGQLRSARQSSQKLNWDVGFTLRANSGNRYTPMLSAARILSYGGIVFGETNSGQLPWNVSLNLNSQILIKMGKKQHWATGINLSCWNLLNRRNVTNYFFRPDMDSPSGVRRQVNLGQPRRWNLGIFLRFGKKA